MLSNPFDLRGPEFLLFYAGLIVCVAAILWALRDHGGKSMPALHGRMPEVTDPYAVACLRGGREEVWRLATVTLIDRDILEVKANGEVGTRRKFHPSMGQNDLERAAIEYFGSPSPAESVFKRPDLLALAKPYEEQLAELGLRPDAALRTARVARHWIAWFVLVGIAGWKIYLAFERGHSNVAFLVILTVLGMFVISLVVKETALTARGKALLNDLRGLFARLKAPGLTRPPGQATQELAWLAAVFGVAALPAAQFAYAQQLYPVRTTSSDGGGGGSSSSDSNSSSCGSSCGGGGCGGGCGGCGS